MLLWLGDQVYADDIPPAIEERIAARDADRRGAPADQVADFEEYTWLYHDAWSTPAVRWLLSTVASAMVFDDHDVHDDWNTSRAWRRTFARKPWWEERVVGALASYWVYQHLGNLSPAAIDEDPLYARVQAHDGDVLPLLREVARQADEDPTTIRWSYVRDLCGTRIVVVDSRAARDLGSPDGRPRRMVDADEWAWVREQAAGDHDHLFLATSVPVVVGHGMHWLEAASEVLAAGRLGRGVAWAAERARRAVDLEHWSAFGRSFDEMAELLDDVAAGRLGRAPASVVLLSGDVHHAYVDRVGFRRDGTARSPVLQAVCSPYRNPLPPGQRRVIGALHGRPAWAAARALGRAVGVPDPPVGWRRELGPWFDNQLAWLELRGRTGRLRFQRSAPGPRLEDLGALPLAD
nr:alkaline phosphatase D family protein [Patulibacter sp. SYSU D01012]